MCLFICRKEVPTIRAYYASKLSENISQTPEGYLICKNVPIARTGAQEYLAGELHLDGVPPDKLVTVHRSEDEVFSPAALASFEGKPLTDDHPSGNVTPDNICRLLKGVCNNIRRGQNEDADKVIADLVAYDPSLINEIMGGKRGISCGYDCDYEFDDEGRIHQRNIRGNHVAVVSAGRAGNEVAIQDKAPEMPAPAISIPNKERRKTNMPKPVTKGSILGKLFSMFSKDADPGAVAEVIDEITEAISPAPTDSEPPAAQPSAPPEVQSPAGGDVPAWAKSLADDIAAIKDQLAQPMDADPLDKLEEELTGSEEAVTVPAEQIGDSEQSGSPMDVEPGATDEDPTNTGTTADTKDAILQVIRAMKPVVASIKDEKQRRAVTDSMERLVRANRGYKPNSQASYAAILGAKQDASKQRATKDAQPAQRAEALGAELARKHNPHYRNKQ